MKKLNRPRREEAKGKELAELKKENNQLRRQVSRLRKEIERLELMSVMDREDHEPAPSRFAPPKKHKLLCPACDNQSFTMTTTPSGKKIYVCKNCKWIGQLNSDSVN